MIRRTLRFFVLTPTLLFTSCALFGGGEPEPPQRVEKVQPKGPSIEAKQVAAQNETSYVTELTFDKGKSTLTKKSQTELQKLIRKAKTQGEIDEIKVITWGDEEYPSVHTKELSDAQIELAKKRNQSIEKFLKQTAQGIEIDHLNMAERPSALQEFIGSEDYRLKRALETAGVPTTDTAVKSPSKASKAIVMALAEDDQDKD